MTISNTNNRVQYTGNGVTTEFAVAFPFQAQADLVVVEVVIATGEEDVKVLNSHYTISGTTDALGHYSSGGTVTATTAPEDTVRWVIYRDPARTQGLDMLDADRFPAESVEAQLDYVTMLIQRVSELVTRTARQPDGDSATISTLPPAVERASMFAAYDADGDPIAAAGTSADLEPVSSFIATLVDDADARTAQTTLQVAQPLPGVRNLRGVREATTTQYTLSADYVSMTRVSTNELDSVVKRFPVDVTIDAAEAGPVANGRDQAGAFTNPSFVHLYYIWDGTTLAGIASVEIPANGPTLPDGYTHWAYATTIPYTTEFDDAYAVRNRVNSSGVQASALTASSATFLNWSAYLPTIASHVYGDCSVTGTSTGGGALDATLTISARSSAPIVPGARCRLFQSGINSTSQALGNIPFLIPLLTAGVYYQVPVVAGSSVAAVINMHGYIVPNGDGV